MPVRTKSRNFTKNDKKYNCKYFIEQTSIATLLGKNNKKTRQETGAVLTTRHFLRNLWIVPISQSVTLN